MHDLELRFAQHWKREGFDSGQKPFLLALSGGVDSMVLAHLLLAAGIPFGAAHCNFGLRGAASDGDEAFAGAWCRTRDIDFYSKKLDVSAAGGSTQTAARALRYEWFEDLRQERGYGAVLTAHHADDVAETMLINLARGTGLAGLHGIPAKRGHILRPLLFATRGDIRSYAHAAGIAWREDASNATTAYLRNAIRHEVMPGLEAALPRASMRMAETAARIAEVEIFYQKAVRKALSRMVDRRGKDWYLPVRLWQKVPGAATLAWEWFTPFGFSAGQVDDILSLLRSGSGRGVAATGYRVVRHRDFLVMSAASETEADLIEVHEVPAQVDTAEGQFRFSWVEAGVPVASDANIAMIDAAEVSLPLVLRTRREGDYFHPLGMGGKKKKLKRFLIDQKVPVHEKERVRILECGKKILWITGYRLDERCRVTPRTGKILKVVFTPC